MINFSVGRCISKINNPSYFQTQKLRLRDVSDSLRCHSLRLPQTRHNPQLHSLIPTLKYFCQTTLETFLSRIFKYSVENSRKLQFTFIKIVIFYFIELTCFYSEGDSEVQGSLMCCSPWGHKELDMTEQQQSMFFYYIYAYFSVF